MAEASLTLMIMSGPDDGRVIHLSQQRGNGFVSADGTWSLVFGRRDECDVNIPFDTQVSRQHAVLRVAQDGEMWLTDAGSLNGTFLGETQLEEPARLQNGQLFRLGRTWMRVQLEVDGE